MNSDNYPADILSVSSRRAVVSTTVAAAVFALMGASSSSTHSLSISTAAHAYPSMTFAIPNGGNVYRNGRHWLAVGHDSAGGEKGKNGKMIAPSPQLNSFGSMMKVEGMHWTQITCNADADGDGYTNGEELGDPDCVWTRGQTPSRTTDISHPGYADSTPTTFKSRSQIESEQIHAEMAFRMESATAAFPNPGDRHRRRGDDDQEFVVDPDFEETFKLLEAEYIEARLRVIERDHRRKNGLPLGVDNDDEDAILAKEEAALQIKIQKMQLEREQRRLDAREAERLANQQQNEEDVCHHPQQQADEPAVYDRRDDPTDATLARLFPPQNATTELNTCTSESNKSSAVSDDEVIEIEDIVDHSTIVESETAAAIEEVKGYVASSPDADDFIDADEDNRNRIHSTDDDDVGAL